MILFKNKWPLFPLFIIMIVSCKNHFRVLSPTGYDLSKPALFVMDASLREISGIAFLKGSFDSIYAIEDENGKLYSYNFKTKQTFQSAFAKK